MDGLTGFQIIIPVLAGLLIPAGVFLLWFLGRLDRPPRHRRLP